MKSFKPACSSKATRRTPKKRNQKRLLLEMLEDRVVPVAPVANFDMNLTDEDTVLNVSAATFPAYFPLIKDDNPVSYYQLDDASDSQGDNDGVATDVTFGHPGIFPGDDPAAPRFAGSATFTGSVNSLIEIPEDPSLDITGTLTLEAWVKPDGTPTSNQGIVAKYIGAGNQRAYNLYYEGQNAGDIGKVGFIISPNGTFSNATVLRSSAPIPIGEWTHVVATYEPGTAMRIYINGVEDTSLTAGVPASIFNSSAPLWIGSQFDASDAGNYFDGMIDEAAIYDSVLNPDQIGNHYETGISSGLLTNDFESSDPENLSAGAQYSYSVLPMFSGGSFYFDDPHVQTAGVFDSGDLTDGVTHPSGNDPTDPNPGPIVGWGEPENIATEIIIDLNSISRVTEVVLGTHTWAPFQNGAPDDVSISFSTTGFAPGDFGSSTNAAFTAADVPTNGHHDLLVDVPDTIARYVKLNLDGGAVLTGDTPNKWMLDEVSILGNRLRDNLSAGGEYSYSVLPTFSGGTFYIDDPHNQTPGVFDSGDLTDGNIFPPGTTPTTPAVNTIVGWGSPVNIPTEIVFDLQDISLVTEVVLGTHTWSPFANGAPDDVEISFSTTGTAPGDFTGATNAAFTAGDVPSDGHHDLFVDVPDTNARYVKLSFDGGAVLTGGTPNKWMLDEVSIFGSQSSLQVHQSDTTSALGADVTVNTDGSYTYDPTTSSLLQSLTDGTTVTDSFTYSLSNLPASLNDGLVGHWPLDGDGTDLSGNNHDGAVIGTPTTVTGQVNQALDFPGNTNRVTIPYDPALNPVNFSVTLWAKAEGGQGGFRSAITSRVGAGGNQQGYILYAADNNNWEFWTGEGNDWDKLQGSPVVLDQWTHFALTFEATSGPSGSNVYTGIKRLFIDGQLVAEDLNASYRPNGTNGANDLHIGSGNDAGNQFAFDGPIDDVGLWNRPLTETEVEALHSGGLDGRGIPTTETATVSIQVTGLSEAPVANDDPDGGLPNPAYTTSEDAVLIVPDGPDDILANDFAIDYNSRENLSFGGEYSYSRLPMFHNGPFYFDDDHVQSVGVFDSGDLTDGITHPSGNAPTVPNPGPIVGWGEPETIAADIIIDLGSINLVTDLTLGTHTWAPFLNGAPDDVTVSFSTTGTAAGDFGNSTNAVFSAADVPTNGHHDLDVDVPDTLARFVKLSFDGGAVLTGGTPNKWMLDEVSIFGNQPSLQITNSDTTSSMGATVVVNPDGSYTYDPSGLETFNSLADGENVTDSFTYTITNGSMGMVPANGRFVRVKNNGLLNRLLHIGEIEVFPAGVAPSGNLDGANDLALLSKGASVESTIGSGGHGSANATIDGQEQTGGATWTKSAVGAEIVIDLGASFDIGDIRVHQRNDNCCQDRLMDFTVSVLADDGTGNPGAVVQSSSFPGQPPNNGFGQLTMDPVLGLLTDTATVSVQVNGENDPPVANDDFVVTDEDTVLNVAPMEPTFNLALNGTASQSTTRTGSGANVAGAAIDGITDGIFDNNSVTHTLNAAFSWWQVELPATSNIDQVVLFNRSDCCGERLSQFRVSVFDGDPDAGGTEVAFVNHPGQVPQGSNVTIDFDPNASGNFIRVAIDPASAAGDPGMDGDGFNAGGGTLSLAEVQVFGNTADGLLNNDTDPDTNDTLEVINFDSISALGAGVNVSPDGSFTYNPGSLFNSLAVGESVTDSFSYTITDSTGLETDTATVTLLVNGLNDAPTANDDFGYETDEDTVLDITSFNLALGGTATQSTTRVGSGANVASAAIDGNTDGNFGNNSVTHTLDEDFSWWQVELPETSNIDEIVLHNRTDCCGNRLSQFRVSVFDGDPDAGGTEVYFFNQPGAVGNTFSIDVDNNVRGNFIRVAIDPASAAGDPGMDGDGLNPGQGGGGTLSLAEVQVFGNPATWVLNNDTDPDANDTLEVISFESTSANGAAVTVDPGGGFLYDPTASESLNSLAAGETIIDTFNYTVSDNPVRFVRVKNNGPDNRLLHIGEIEVFATGIVPSGNLDNANDLALSSKGASVESTIGGGGHGSANATIDGLEQTGAAVWTRLAVGAEIVIDLGASFAVETVRVHQRNDGCCQDRLSDFTVSVLEDDGTGNPGTVIQSSSFPGIAPTDGFAEFQFQTGDIATVSVQVNGVNDPPTANDDFGYVTDEDTVLNVAAMEPTTNLALGGTASQSTTRTGSGANVAGAAIDGNTDGVFLNNSVTHTLDAAFTWWQVELPQMSNIDEVVLFNRSDCCGNRLSQFRVSVFDGDPDVGGTEVAFVNNPGQVSQGGNVTLDFDSGARGNFIRVAIDPASAAGDPGMDGDGLNSGQGGGGILSLAEVQVFGNTFDGVLNNDTDPDNGDLLEVISFDSTSANGASVTVNADGGFSYDPTGVFDSLAPGDMAMDTFGYTVADSVSIFDTSGNIGGGGQADLVTLTNADIGSARTLTLDYTASRDDLSGGDSWFAVGINPASTGSAGDIVLTSDSGWLIRTTAPNDTGLHQLFDNGAPAIDSAASTPASTETHVTATIILSPGGIQAGETARIFVNYDDGNDGTIDHTLSDFFTFGSSQMNVRVSANSQSHTYTNFSIFTGRETISDLFSTGVDNSGMALGNNVNDSHYELIVDPSGLGDATVIDDDFPIPPWFANDGDSRWIGPADGGDASGPGGNYTYETTFTLPANIDLSSVRITGNWGTDNDGLDILINGNSTGITSTGFASPTHFTIDSGFVAGLNTLEFVVNNAGTSSSPTGLRVDNLLGVYDSFGTDTAMVKLTVTGVNDAPTVAADVDPVRVDEGDTAMNTGTFDDVDVGDTVTITASVGNISQDNNNNTWSWSLPTSDQSDTQQVTITATDSLNAQTSVTFDLIVGNVPPVANPDNYTTDEETPITATAGDLNFPGLLDNDTDASILDILQVIEINNSGSLTGTSTQGAPITVNPAGSFTYDPTGLFDSLAVGDMAMDSFTYTVSDSEDILSNVGGNLGGDSQTILTTLTNADIGSDRTLVLDYTVMRDELSGGDSWFGVGINSSNTSTTPAVVTTADIGWLIRTIPNNTGTHQSFGANNDQADSTLNSTEAHVSAIISLSANGIQNGESASIILRYDDGNDGSIDHVLSGSFTFSSSQMLIRLATQDKAHTYSDFTISTGPETIADLFNTGVDNSGNPLGDNVDDPHYDLIVDPSGLGDATVTDDDSPIPPWVANDDDSRWIGPADGADAFGPPGDYTYRTTFTLNPSIDLSTVKITGAWGTDNDGLDILINGVSTGATSGGFDSLTPFTIDSGFVSGINTLDFVVNNAGSSANPAGLRVDKLLGTYESTNVGTVDIKINGVNDAPTVAVDNDPITVDEGDTATNTGTFDDIDMGDIVDISSSIGLVSQDNNAKTWSWSFDATDESDTQQVTITATDSQNAQAMVTFDLVVNNVPPVANPDTYTTNEDTVLTGTMGDPTFPGLVDNDTDAGIFDVLTVTEINGSGSLTGFSALGAGVTVDVSGNFTYDPTTAAALQVLATGESLVDTFTYTLSDGDGGFDTGMVSITVNGNDPIEVNTNHTFVSPFSSPPGPVGGDSIADQVQLDVNGGNLEIRVNGDLLRTTPALDVDVVITGSGDDDTVIINGKGTGDVVIDGGGEMTAPGDTVQVNLGSFGTVVHNMTGVGSGNVDLDNNNDPEIIYTTLERVDLTGITTSEVIFNFPVGSDDGDLSESGTLLLEGATFAGTEFNAPLDLVEFNGGLGDTLTLGGTFNFTAAINLNIGTTDLTGDLAGSGGDITLGNNATLTSSSGTGTIQDRTIVVPGASNGVEISNLAKVTKNGGTAVNIAGTAMLDNNLIEDSVTGVEVTGSATFVANVVQNNDTGVDVNNGSLTLSRANGGNQIINDVNSLDGLLLRGDMAQLSDGTQPDNNHLGNTLFQVPTLPGGPAGGGNYIRLADSAFFGDFGEPELVDASDATFEDVSTPISEIGADLTGTIRDQVEDRIVHFLDVDTVGLILYRSNVAFVDGGELVVLGDNRNNRISINATDLANVTVHFGPQLQTDETTQANFFDLTQGPNPPLITVLTFAGEDKIRITSDVTARVFSGDDDDDVRTGAGDDFLSGGTGNDRLRSGKGNDIIIGGLGRDKIYAEAGDDLVVAGATSLGPNGLLTLASDPDADAALEAIAMTVIDPDDRNNLDRIESGSGRDRLSLRLSGRGDRSDFDSSEDAEKDSPMI